MIIKYKVQQENTSPLLQVRQKAIGILNWRNLILLRTSLLIWAISLLTIGVICSCTGKISSSYATLDGDGWETAYDEWKTIAAFPWLVTNHSSQAIFLSLYNDLDGLLMFMSGKTQKIAVVRFNHPWQIMLQNEIYTLAKFGQVHNYIVMVADEDSLQVCLALNLPCYNGTKYYKNYYHDIDPAIDAVYSDKEHYRPMNWFKLRFYRDILVKNYTILAFDTDIAFSRKNLWLSLERYSENIGDCDMLFMQEHPVNAGFFYSKSNPRTIMLFNQWVATERPFWHLDEQRSFGAMRGYYYEICNTTNHCNSIRQNKMINMRTNLTESFDMPIVTVRTFLAAYYRYGTGVCPAHKKIDPCLETTAFLHTVCLVGQPKKVTALRKNGFWLLEEQCAMQSIHSSSKQDANATLRIYRCKPLILTNPNAEQDFERCKDEIAWKN